MPQFRAFNTGASWDFPEDLPGSWTTEPEPAPAQTETPNRSSDGRSYDAKPRRERTHWPPRQCRICLDVVQPTLHADVDSSLPGFSKPMPRVTYESEEGGRLLSPCKCKGSQKYVHEDCLNAWRRADPSQKRNYWECPTCKYRYRLQRLTWSSWIGSTSAQIVLTFAIFLTTIFLLGFVADPIINLYLDPYDTIATRGGPGGSLIFEDEDPTWAEHFVKGMASLGLLGFAKFMLSLSPFHWFRTGGIFGTRTVGGTGRDRLAQISLVTLIIGIITFLWAVWKGVRAWSRRTLKQASERVVDVFGDEDDADD